MYTRVADQGHINHLFLINTSLHRQKQTTPDMSQTQCGAFYIISQHLSVTLIESGRERSDTLADPAHRFGGG